MSDPVFEIQTEEDRAIPLRLGGYDGPILRVKYRVNGKRLWTKILIVPDEGQTLDDLRMLAPKAVGQHYKVYGAAS